jgi:hypothetical protein
MFQPGELFGQRILFLFPEDCRVAANIPLNLMVQMKNSVPLYYSISTKTVNDRAALRRITDKHICLAVLEL